MFDLLRRPGVGFDELASLAGRPGRVFHVKPCAPSSAGSLADQVIASIETSARYAGYIDKQQDAGRAQPRMPTIVDLPASLDYAAVQALVVRGPAGAGPASPGDDRSGRRACPA